MRWCNNNRALVSFYAPTRGQSKTGCSLLVPFQRNTLPVKNYCLAAKAGDDGLFRWCDHNFLFPLSQTTVGIVAKLTTAISGDCGTVGGGDNNQRWNPTNTIFAVELIRGVCLTLHCREGHFLTLHVGELFRLTIVCTGENHLKLSLIFITKLNQRRSK